MPLIDPNDRTWQQVRQWASARLKTHIAKLMTTGDDDTRARIRELKELLKLAGESPAVLIDFTQENTND